MANRHFYDARAIEPETITVTAVLTILGNTTPANGTFTIVEGGRAFGTFVRTGTGTYTLRLADVYPKCVGFQASIFPHNNSARGIRPGAVDVANPAAASRTVGFTVLNTAEAAVDTPNGETDRVYLTLFLKNSSAR